ncbi:MAG TPA: pantoate--beta-alanine ligase [Terriglobales bacterium]|nr:pantoate--beta-alanine ligase [Terriglobales bacterium]
MKVLHTIEETRALCRQAQREGKVIGFVPTMGALHDGHLSLVRAARSQTNFVVVSIFVNPLQFGPNEDLAKYPRTFERDCELLKAEGVTAIFAPTPEEMYPTNAATFVEVEGLPQKLEGRTRPTHFRGVTTVVAKLFNVVRPDFAYFGQKDAQQVVILSKMVRDLNMDVRIVVMPIVRERDGLAMSSRNRYLDAEHRRQGLVLYRALTRIQTLADQGERRAARLLEEGKSVVAEGPEVRLDYLEIVDRETLDPIEDVSRGALVAIAAFVGPTRLIDNTVLMGAGEAEVGARNR